MTPQPPPDDDRAWQAWRAQWALRPGTTYLNHGSFGPPPRPVRRARRTWQDRLDAQPMDFFVRTFEPAIRDARSRLARFVGAACENLVLVENATYAMNVVAASFPLSPGDEVLLTDHEYGAVVRIWERACRRAGTVEPRIAGLPPRLESAEEVADAVFTRTNERTRLLIFSHVTSPTAAILPAAAICRAARARGIATCVDGPHAPVQVPLAIDALDCDYYTASCHKWLCAPFGSGFLYVHPRRQPTVEPIAMSWGRLLPEKPARWDDEFTWVGTRDASALLSVPAAIEFFESIGLEAVRARMHCLARYARGRLVELTGTEPITPDSPRWYGSMALAPLPPGDGPSLQKALWERHGIEVPIIQWGGRRLIRVSCHLYTQREDIEHLVRALGKELAGEM